MRSLSLRDITFNTLVVVREKYCAERNSMGMGGYSLSLVTQNVPNVPIDYDHSDKQIRV